jgi:hypothetical protein
MGRPREKALSPPSRNIARHKCTAIVKMTKTSPPRRRNATKTESAGNGWELVVTQLSW